VVHAVVITLFVVITAPVTAMLLARAAVYRSERRARSPD
jgi:multisubunit Na+/H+ antiporter MnhG subunit